MIGQLNLYIDNVTDKRAEISNTFVFDRQRLGVVKPRTLVLDIKEAFSLSYNIKRELCSLFIYNNNKYLKSMSTNNFDSNEVTFQVDLNEATLAVKENRFSDALKILEIILKDNPDQ